MCATVAGTPSLSLRRKSISRYARLWPPPWCRVVTLPWTLRPPLECSGRISDFSGVERVISAKSDTLEPRRPGVVGLYLRIPILVSPSARRATEHVDRPALLRERDDRALGVLALAVAGAGALALARAVQRVDAEHLDPEHLLHGDLDLCLVGVRPDDEGVLALVEQPVALLRDHRRQQDVPRVLVNRAQGAHSCASVTFEVILVTTGLSRKDSSAPRVNTTSSAQSTSYALSWSETSTWTFSRL